MFFSPLCSTFCQKYLHELSEKDLQDYDNLLNDYNNEWDIYYWMVKTKEVPEGYQTNVMKMLQVCSSWPKMVVDNPMIEKME